MAVRWIEGFETFGSSGATGSALEGELQKKYDEASTLTGVDAKLSAGRGSGLALEWGDENVHYFRKALDAQATWVIGFAIKLPATLSFTGTWLEILDGGSVQIALKRSVSTLQILRGTTVLDSCSIQAGVWYYVEVKVTINDTTGSYEVRLNGVNVMSGSNVDTQQTANATADGFKFYGDTYATVLLDDLYVLDGTGSTNNDFLGDMKVSAILPNGDVSGESDFTRSGGTPNYENVDENPSDDDASYVESGTSNDRDLYDYENIDAGVTGIKGVQINTQARVTDAQSQTLITSCKSNTTVSEDSGESIGSTTYNTSYRVMEQDPDTSAAWTASGLNAASFGVKVG